MHNTDIAAQQPRLTEVRLYGDLREKFGPSFNLAIFTPAEAIRALCAMIPGFQTHFGRPGAAYKLYSASDRYSVEMLHYPVTGRTLRIVPVIAGAGGNGGFGQILLGAVLITASFYIPGSWAIMNTTIGSMVFSAGVGMVLGGVAQLIAGSPKAPEVKERPENQPSYVFSGPVNTVEVGGPVPLLYGELEIGSQVISAGMSTTQINIPEPVVPPSTPENPNPVPSGEGTGPLGGGGEDGVNWYHNDG